MLIKNYLFTKFINCNCKKFFSWKFTFACFEFLVAALSKYRKETFTSRKISLIDVCLFKLLKFKQTFTVALRVIPTKTRYPITRRNAKTGVELREPAVGKEFEIRRKTIGFKSINQRKKPHYACSSPPSAQDRKKSLAAVRNKKKARNEKRRASFAFKAAMKPPKRDANLLRLPFLFTLRWLQDDKKARGRSSSAR